MDSKLVGFLCFFSIMTLGHALKCNMCGSHESMSLCMKYKTPKQCDSWEDRCYKAEVNQVVEGKRYKVFQRGCASAWQCTTKSLEMCTGPKGQYHKLDCYVNCCSGDFCNSATPTVVSVLALLACALVAFCMGW